jgi:hypothetical protein
MIEALPCPDSTLQVFRLVDEQNLLNPNHRKGQTPCLLVGLNSLGERSSRPMQNLLISRSGVKVQIDLLNIALNGHIPINVTGRTAAYLQSVLIGTG